MNKQDELLEKEIYKIVRQHTVGHQYADKCAKEVIAKVKQHYEQKQLESDAFVKKLLNETIRLAEQSFIPPVDLITKARAELADLEARRLK